MNEESNSSDLRSSMSTIREKKTKESAEAPSIISRRGSLSQLIKGKDESIPAFKFSTPPSYLNRRGSNLTSSTSATPAVQGRRSSFHSTNQASSRLSIETPRSQNIHSEFVGLKEFKRLNANQIKLFEQWCKERAWKKFHNSHYDWWIFPICDKSNFGFKYSIFDEKDREFMKNYIRGIQLVCLSWGWDLRGMEEVSSPDIKRSQVWNTFASVRLYKAHKSAKQFVIETVAKSLNKFAIKLLDSGHKLMYYQFDYEPYFRSFHNPSLHLPQDNDPTTPSSVIENGVSTPQALDASLMMEFTFLYNTPFSDGDDIDASVPASEDVSPMKGEGKSITTDIIVAVQMTPETPILSPKSPIEMHFANAPVSETHTVGETTFSAYDETTLRMRERYSFDDGSALLMTKTVAMVGNNKNKAPQPSTISNDNPIEHVVDEIAMHTDSISLSSSMASDPMLRQQAKDMLADDSANSSDSEEIYYTDIDKGSMDEESAYVYDDDILDDLHLHSDLDDVSLINLSASPYMEIQASESDPLYDVVANQLDQVLHLDRVDNNDNSNKLDTEDFQSESDSDEPSSPYSSASSRIMEATPSGSFRMNKQDSSRDFGMSMIMDEDIGYQYSPLADNMDDPISSQDTVISSYSNGMVDAVNPHQLFSLQEETEADFDVNEIHVYDADKDEVSLRNIPHGDRVSLRNSVSASSSMPPNDMADTISRKLQPEYEEYPMNEKISITPHIDHVFDDSANFSFDANPIVAHTISNSISMPYHDLNGNAQGHDEAIHTHECYAFDDGSALLLTKTVAMVGINNNKAPQPHFMSIEEPSNQRPISPDISNSTRSISSEALSLFDEGAHLEEEITLHTNTGSSRSISKHMSMASNPVLRQLAKNVLADDSADVPNSNNDDNIIDVKNDCIDDESTSHVHDVDLVDDLHLHSDLDDVSLINLSASPYMEIQASESDPLYDVVANQLDQVLHLDRVDNNDNSNKLDTEDFQSESDSDEPSSPYSSASSRIMEATPSGSFRMNKQDSSRDFGMSMIMDEDIGYQYSPLADNMDDPISSQEIVVEKDMDDEYEVMVEINEIPHHMLIQPNGTLINNQSDELHVDAEIDGSDGDVLSYKGVHAVDYEDHIESPPTNFFDNKDDDLSMILSKSVLDSPAIHHSLSLPLDHHDDVSELISEVILLSNLDSRSSEKDVDEIQPVVSFEAGVIIAHDDIDQSHHSPATNILEELLIQNRPVDIIPELDVVYDVENDVDEADSHNLLATEADENFDMNEIYDKDELASHSIDQVARQTLRRSMASATAVTAPTEINEGGDVSMIPLSVVDHSSSQLFTENTGNRVVYGQREVVDLDDDLIPVNDLKQDDFDEESLNLVSNNRDILPENEEVISEIANPHQLFSQPDEAETHDLYVPNAYEAGFDMNEIYDADKDNDAVSSRGNYHVDRLALRRSMTYTGVAINLANINEVEDQPLTIPPIAFLIDDSSASQDCIYLGEDDRIPVHPATVSVVYVTCADEVNTIPIEVNQEESDINGVNLVYEEPDDHGDIIPEMDDVHVCEMNSNAEEAESHNLPDASEVDFNMNEIYDDDEESSHSIDHVDRLTLRRSLTATIISPAKSDEIPLIPHPLTVDDPLNSHDSFNHEDDLIPAQAAKHIDVTNDIKENSVEVDHQEDSDLMVVDFVYEDTHERGDVIPEHDEVYEVNSDVENETNPHLLSQQDGDGQHLPNASEAGFDMNDIYDADKDDEEVPSHSIDHVDRLALRRSMTAIISPTKINEDDSLINHLLAEASSSSADSSNQLNSDDEDDDGDDHDMLVQLASFPRSDQLDVDKEDRNQPIMVIQIDADSIAINPMIQQSLTVFELDDAVSAADATPAEEKKPDNRCMKRCFCM